MKKILFYIFFLSVLLSSCSGYEKLLKSNDNKLKLEEAKKYYEKNKYLRAITLFDAVVPYYKGTTQSEEILFLTAQSYLGNQDYISAASLFEIYIKSYENGQYTEECAFLKGYCHYKESPDVRLDQTETILAINAFYDFIDTYPSSEKATEAEKYLSELNNKLAEKAYLNAKLYYNLGNYLGNNYLSAIITANNALKDYSGNKYKEEFSFLILESRFKQAELSVAEKKEERYRETIDEYNNFISEYPESKYLKGAEKILESSKKYLNE